MEKPGDHALIAFKAPLALRDDLRRVAEQSERTMSAEIRHALREHVRKQKEGTARR
jgi:predicted transcriptional regulator